MNLLDILIGKRKVRNEYLKREQDSFVSRWARPPSRNTSEWMEMFSKSPRLAVVDRIASDLATVPGHLMMARKMRLQCIDFLILWHSQIRCMK